MSSVTSPHVPGPGATARNATVVIAVILAGAALKALSDIVGPLLLAIFLAVMVDGLSRVIRARAPNAPRGSAVAAAIALGILAVILSALIVAGSAPGFAASLRAAGPRLISGLARLAGPLGPGGHLTADQILTRIDPAAWLGVVAQGLQDFISSLFLVLVYLGFLIASRHAFERKAVRLFRGRDERHEALRVFLAVRDGVERYLWIQTVTGLIIAAAAFVVMVAVGLNNALFWAFLIFVINYVPIIGAAAAIVLPALFAVVQFPGLGPAAVILVALFVITFVVGNILLPRMQGRSLNMDPLVVLLSLAFWGALLGLTGMFLSTPLTALAMEILAQFEGSRWIAVLLSADGDPGRLGRGYDHSPAEADA